MTTGRKALFNNWFDAALRYVQGQYCNCDLWLSADFLEKRHWYKLWQIFENHIEKPTIEMKEMMEAHLASYDVATEVILEAYGKPRSKLDWELQMDHYMSSSKYD